MAIQQQQHNDTSYWFDEQLVDHVEAAMFSYEYWHQRNAVIGSAQGRGTTWFMQGFGLELAMRHYHRGGLFGRLVKDSYWFTGWDKTRCAEELKILHRLSEGGVNVPRPVAARAVRRRATYRADIITQKIANAADFVAILQHQTLDGAVWHETGVMIRKMHDLQVCHTDLNAHNLLIDNANRVWLIDFDKCYVSHGDSWKKKNISRLHRSLVKEQAKRGILWQPSDWQALLDGYRSEAK